jgi:hypothetical protein
MSSNRRDLGQNFSYTMGAPGSSPLDRARRDPTIVGRPLALSPFRQFAVSGQNASIRPVFAVLWQPFQKSAAVHLRIELIDDSFIEWVLQQFDLQHFSKIPRHEFSAAPAVNFGQKTGCGPIRSRLPIHVSSSFFVRMPLLQKSYAEWSSFKIEVR